MNGGQSRAIKPSLGVHDSQAPHGQTYRSFSVRAFGYPIQIERPAKIRQDLTGWKTAAGSKGLFAEEGPSFVHISMAVKIFVLRVNMGWNKAFCPRDDAPKEASIDSLYAAAVINHTS